MDEAYITSDTASDTTDAVTLTQTCNGDQHFMEKRQNSHNFSIDSILSMSATSMMAAAAIAKTRQPQLLRDNGFSHESGSIITEDPSKIREDCRQARLFSINHLTNGKPFQAQSTESGIDEQEENSYEAEADLDVASRSSTPVQREATPLPNPFHIFGFPKGMLLLSKQM